MLDVVVIDRDNALTLDEEARRLLLTLRNIERLTHDARDDLARTIYGEVRAALGHGRWIAGGIAEALG